MRILIEFRGVPGSGARAAATRRTVNADWIRVGRNAACELHLPDPRVPLAQGMIVNRDGLVYIEGESGSKDITRKTVHSVRMKPGVPIDIGPYRMRAIAAPEGYDGAIAVEQVRPLEATADIATRSTGLTLAALGIPKRGAAWALGLAVLVFALLIPAGRVFHLPWSKVAAQSAVGDRVWDPGPLILAHQPIEQKCAACHERPFRHVRDAACLECHRSAGHHVAPQLHRAALFGDSRCASCHREHKGIKPVFRDDDRFCVECHRDLRARVPEATAENVSDFAKAHPAFRVSIPDGAAIRRVREDRTPLTRKSALIYPHKPHLDPKGVRSPDEGRVKLDCCSCHHPDASGRSFEPISMARDCQRCHRLQFEPAVTTREVPHGKTADAVTVIAEFYGNLALNGTRDSFQKAFGVPGEGLLRRVGDPGDEDRRAALRLASVKAKRVARDLFAVRVCKTCHTVTQVDKGETLEWRVEPVRTGNRWMPHARFDHRAHAASRCTDCHDVRESKSANDLAMPTIEDCRKCHGGSTPAAKKVTSNCLLCHGFHDPKLPWNGATVGRVAVAR